MHPEVLKIGTWRFHTYPLMLAIAFVVCTLLTVREAQRRGIMLLPHVGIWALLGALFGAKVYWILEYWEPKELWRALLLWQGSPVGLVYYGGLIGGVGAVLLYLRLQKLPIVKCLDCAAPYLALGQAIVRFGCFMNGCCWGKPTKLPWGVCFPAGRHAWKQQVKDGLLSSSAAESLPVHPTQLYMLFGLLVVFALLKWWLSRRRYDGSVVVAYCFLYGWLRYAVEFARGDPTQFVYALRLAQMLSLSLVTAAVVVETWRHVAQRRTVPPITEGVENETPEQEDEEESTPRGDD